MEESHGDAESGGCARGFVTSSNPSAWPWQRCCTTRTTGCTPSTALHGARTQPPGPGEGERVTRRSTRRSSGKTPPPQAFFQLYDEEDAERGVRPGSAFDPVPQGRVERHVVEHRIETCPFVQIRDAPVPQLGNQVLELLQKIVSSLVEPVQVIEVPKMFMPTRCPRTVLSVPQTAEQLVDVPTIISYSSLQRAVEQTIDFPVPQARQRGRGGQQGFRTGQGTPAADMEQIVEIPVPQRRRRRSGGLQNSHPGQGSTAFLEHIVDIPAREGLQGFLPGQGSSSSSRLHGGTDDGIQGVFSHFSPRRKKCGGRSALGVGTGCGLYSMDAGGS